MLKKLKSQKGVSLFLGLVIMTIFLSMGLGLTLILMSQREVIRGIDYSVNAVTAADTGVEKTLYLDKRCATESTFCSSNPTLCDPDCVGLVQSYNDSSPLGDSGATYDVTFNRNCGISSIKSSGKYRSVRRAFDITYGASLAGSHLNSASNESCSVVCQQLECVCSNIGLNSPTPNDGNYYDWAGACGPPVSGGNCFTVMNEDPIPHEYCPDEATGNPTWWTYCNCQ